MTMTTMSSVLKLNESPTKKSYQTKRYVTDVSGWGILFLLLFLMMLTSCLFLFFDAFYSREYLSKKTLDAAVNESWSDLVSLNSSMKVIYGTFSSIIGASTNYKLSSCSFILDFISGLLRFLSIIIGLCCLGKYARAAVKSINKSSESEYNHHFIIFSAGKLIMTSFFLILIRFQYVDTPWFQRNDVGFLPIIEIVMLLVNVMVTFLPEVTINYQHFKSTLRYYISYRYLILFKFLNFMGMLLWMAIAIKLYSTRICITPAIQIIAIFVIYSMHYYGEMVIILTKASRNWEQDGETIGIKTLLSSMNTIRRYHFGTVYMYVLIIPYISPWYLADIYNGYGYDMWKNVNKKEKLSVKDNATSLIEHLKMFTAIHGLNISSSVKCVHYLKRKNQLLPHFKNIPSSAWTVILYLSIPIALIMGEFISKENDVQDFFTRIIILASYIAVTASYYYVIIRTMSTIENTIEFCKMMKNKDIEIMLQDVQPKSTDESQENIVTPSVDGVGEIEHDEVSKNNEKFVE